jgi:hypothetical protein
VDIEIIIIDLIINMHSLREETAIADQVAGIQVEAHFIKISEVIIRELIKEISSTTVEINQREKILSGRNLTINFRTKNDVIMLVIVLDATINQEENST